MKNGILSLVTGAALCFLSAPASAAILIYDATLPGPSESPLNASPATGFARVTIDDFLDTMRVETTFSGRLGTTTAITFIAASIPRALISGVANRHRPSPISRWA